MAPSAPLILLTGSSGFVGRQVLRMLAERDCALRLVTRRGVRREESRAFVESEIETSDLFTESSEWYARLCEGVDTIIHLAWYAEPSHYLQSPKNIECVKGTIELARAAATAGVRRFVGVGTCFEYDLTRGVLSTDTPLRPRSIYAASKAAAYMVLSQLLPQLGTEFAWCRLFYLFGEGEDSRRLVPYVRAKLKVGESAELTSGKQIRDYLDVEAAARMMVDAAFSNQQGAINICSEKPVSVRQLAEQIADEYGRRDLLLFGARPDNLTDPPIVVGVRNAS